MKPDWKDAPDWAMWLAQDTNGDWYWYEIEPTFMGDEWSPNDGRACKAGSSDFELAPEPRP